MKRHLMYLSYVLRHKWYVFVEGLKLGVPVWWLVLHDWSKFLPLEWFSYARTFYTLDGTKQYAPHNGFYFAWNAHEKRHKHHWQYWVLVLDTGDLISLEIPDRHRREMLADWRGAGRALGKPDTTAWYAHNRDNIMLHEKTREWIEQQLGIVPSGVLPRREVLIHESVAVVEADSLYDTANRIASAFNAGAWDSETWVVDVFDAYVIVRVGDFGGHELYRVNYRDDGERVEFDTPPDWQLVTLEYVPAGSTAPSTDDTSADPGAGDGVDQVADTAESGVMIESTRAVIESTANGDEAVIIVAGLSANNREYTVEALATGVPIFSNASMYIDHPTTTESRERPERSVRDLVGRLGEAYVGTDRNGNPALRAPFIISESEQWLRQRIREGIVSGLSIRARGTGTQRGEVFVVEQFIESPYTSVDFVTVPAAGGYASLSESGAHTANTATGSSDRVEVTVQGRGVNDQDDPAEISETATPSTVVELRETVARLEAQNAELLEAQRRGVAREIVESVLDDTRYRTLPEATRERITAQVDLAVDRFVEHNGNDAQLREVVEQAVESERAYLAAVSQHGVVTGLQPAAEQVADPDDIVRESLRGIVPDEQLEVAVRGRRR